MSGLKDSLIGILELNDVDALCGSWDTVRCHGRIQGVGCEECPYGSEENKQQLIKELQND